MTNQVTYGDTVTFHYRGTLQDGEEFDNSRKTEPVTTVIGSGQLLTAFEAAITGVDVGSTTTFTLTSDEAYGPINEEATTTLSKDLFPDDFEFDQGMFIPLESQDGKNVLSTLKSVEETEIVVDFNHPMAGKDLTFEVEILESTSTPEDEVTDP